MARRRDWRDSPGEPRPHGRWSYLPHIALAAALLGLVAGASLSATDREHYDRLMIGAGLIER